MRKLVNIKATPATINSIITAWESVLPSVGSTITGKSRMQGVIHYAIPEEGTALYVWIPSFGDLTAMVRGLKSSRAASLATLKLSMSSYSLRLKRYTTSLQQLEDICEQAGLSGDDALPPELRTLAAKVRKTAGTLVTYKGWLQVLGVAGVLDTAVIDAVRNKTYRARLRRMQEDLAKDGGILYMPRFTDGVDRPREALKGDVTMTLRDRGTLDIVRTMYDGVLQEPLRSVADFPGTVGTFVGHRLTGEIQDGRGMTFVNCVLKDVTFLDSMSGAEFIACEFDNVKVIPPEGERVADAENVTLKHCYGFLSLRYAKVKDLRAHGCGDLEVDFSWSTVTRSQIRDGWIKAWVNPADPEARQAPRYISSCGWENGGIDVSCLGVSDTEIKSDVQSGIVRSLIMAVLPESVRLAGAVEVPETGETRSGYDAAVYALDDLLMTTRQVAEYPWKIIS